MMESCWLSCSSLQKKYPAFQYVPLLNALDACLYLPVMNVPYVLAFTPITFWNEVAVTLYFWEKRADLASQRLRAEPLDAHA
jgi:hypothetical protein